MARYLSVEYLQSDASEPPALQKAIALTADMLFDFPEELLEELLKETLTLNREAIYAIIEQIEEQAPDTAKGLRSLMENFQMGRILELLEKVE